ncbi:MAG TPA: response regulator transcription factor [Candidatus Limnocylindria bacterium]|nr:response regulator transcription factor [Candidatus Limnocylindria bacterium]
MSPSPRSLTPFAPRVVIVDADRRVQQSLADLLGIGGEVRVVGRASDVRAALEMVEETRPDAVLVDPRLPDVEAGVALIRGLETAWPDLRIVLTGWSDTEGHAALSGGQCRYVSKSGSPEDFVSTLVACCSA